VIALGPRGGVPARAAEDRAPPPGAREEIDSRGSQRGVDNTRRIGARSTEGGTGAVVLVRDPRLRETPLYAPPAPRARAPRRFWRSSPPLRYRRARRSASCGGREKIEPIWAGRGAHRHAGRWSLSPRSPRRGPLVAATHPGVGTRTIDRHLVPAGLFARFEPRTRGGSDYAVARSTSSRPGRRPAPSRPSTRILDPLASPHRCSPPAHLALRRGSEAGRRRARDGRSKPVLAAGNSRPRLGKL